MVKIEGNYLARTQNSVVNLKVARVGRNKVCVTGETNGRKQFQYTMAEEDFCKMGYYLQATKED